MSRKIGSRFCSRFSSFVALSISIFISLRIDGNCNFYLAAAIDQGMGSLWGWFTSELLIFLQFVISRSFQIDLFSCLFFYRIEIKVDVKVYIYDVSSLWNFTYVCMCVEFSGIFVILFFSKLLICKVK